MNHTPLKHLFPGWFAVVMGWAGLALAWHRAAPLMGDLAQGLALVATAVAALVFVALGAATLLRWQRHGEALREDLAHPVRHTFFAAIPVSGMLLATLAVALLGADTPGVDALWGLSSLVQFGVTLWVLARWISGPAGGAGHKPNWSAVTPVMFIPVVGNVVAPLAGLPLGHSAWASAQFGVGLLFWPVILVLNFVRIAQAGLPPERMLPTLFIVVAPPAVVGTAALQYGASAALVWMLWGMALFLALWAATQARRMTSMAFGIAHWGMSFPLAAFAALTLRLAGSGDGAWLQVPALALLALASLVILGLSFATVRGLRAGTLLVPEGPPVIPLQPQPGAA